MAGPMLCAQDTLVYTNGERIVGQVEEIGVELVRYTTTSSGSVITIVVEKLDLARIRLRDGQQFVFGSISRDVPGSEAFMARKQQIALDIVAPALDHVTLTYEHVLGRHMSITGSAGYIGLWQEGHNVGNRSDNSGALMKAGVKFLLPRASRRYPNARTEHRLAGWFLKPEFMFSYWTERTTHFGWPGPPNGTEYVSRSFYSSLALNLVIGTQILLGERISFGIHGGMGYGGIWRNGSTPSYPYGPHSDQIYAYSHSFFDANTPLCVSGGVQFGFVF